MASANPYDKSDGSRLQALNTLSVDKSAFNLWRAFRKNMKLPITPEIKEIENDGAQDIMMELCIFASSRPIPLNFDEDLMPPESQTHNRCVKASTLGKYVGKALKFLRGIYPQHPDWKDLDPRDNTKVPYWWTSIKDAFIDKCNRNEMKYQGDASWGDSNTHPLYLDLGAGPSDAPLRQCDLKYVITSLVENAAANNKNLEDCRCVPRHAVRIRRYHAGDH